jgi:hypothetical protein
VENPGSSEAVTMFYSIAGMIVAMDDGTDVVYFAADHLSSASVVMDSNGDLVSENRYMPFGEVREILGHTEITQTDFGYTNQRNYAMMGLMDYRIYDHLFPLSSPFRNLLFIFIRYPILVPNSCPPLPTTYCHLFLQYTNG